MKMADSNVIKGNYGNGEEKLAETRKCMNQVESRSIKTVWI